MARKPTRAKALGVSDDEYARLLAAQDGHCALCPNTPPTEVAAPRSWTCRSCWHRNPPRTSVCARCAKPRPKPRRFPVDHDHKTGRVRGLLCYACNKYLPASRDADWHRAAADYLDPPPKPRVKLPADLVTTPLLSVGGVSGQAAAYREAMGR